MRSFDQKGPEPHNSQGEDLQKELLSASFDGEGSGKGLIEGEALQKTRKELEEFEKIAREATLLAPPKNLWPQIKGTLKKEGSISRPHIQWPARKVMFTLLKHPLAAAVIFLLLFVHFQESKQMLASLMVPPGPLKEERQPTPPAIRWLLIANILVFVLTFVLYKGELNLFPALGLVPSEVFSKGHLWQFFTSLFLHGDVMHLFVNLLFLWMFGREIERGWSKKEFLSYYFLCGFTAGLATYFLSPAHNIPTIGASGAIFGILAAYLLMFGDRELLVFFVLPLKARYVILAFCGLELWACFHYTPDGIAHFAHLGGALGGFLYLKWRWWRMEQREIKNLEGPSGSRFQNLDF